MGDDEPDVAEQASEPPAPVEGHDDAVIVDAEEAGPQAEAEPAATPPEPPAAEAVEVSDAVVESAPSDEAPAEEPDEPAEAAADTEAAVAEAEAVEAAEPTAAEAGRDSLFGGVLAPDTDAELDEATLDDVRSWVRPYVWTGGRTDTTLEFELETLVSARKQEAADEDPDQMRDEHRCVLDLCDQPRSVTEIAALLSVPLGVAKTLLGVMAEENMLVVHSNGDTSGIGPDLQLMERVLRGLRKL